MTCTKMYGEKYVTEEVGVSSQRKLVFQCGPLLFPVPAPPSFSHFTEEFAWSTRYVRTDPGGRTQSVTSYFCNEVGRVISFERQGSTVLGRFHKKQNIHSEVRPTAVI